MTVFALAFLAAFVIALGILVALSPARLDPLRDANGQPIPGSLSERVVVEIGGVKQGMFVQCVDPSNPVLLLLHGGPGMPDWFLNIAYPTGLERHFTMVWWEQRGAGMSFSPDLDPADMTINQLIADTIEVADYLWDRFGQDKVYLLGHSFGSFFGIQVANHAPDRFHAYIGMAQVAHQMRSEELSHAAMRAAYAERGDSKMVSRLDVAPVRDGKGMSPAYLALRDTAMHRLGGGTTREMRSVITGVFLPIWSLRAYSLREKINIWRCKAWSRNILWDEVLTTDLISQITALDLPVYFFTGQHDLTAYPDLSRQFFDQIAAPVKGYYVFETSAHSPLFEEPGRARDILVHDVIPKTNGRADAT